MSGLTRTIWSAVTIMYYVSIHSIPHPEMTARCFLLCKHLVTPLDGNVNMQIRCEWAERRNAFRRTARLLHQNKTGGIQHKASNWRGQSKSLIWNDRRSCVNTARDILWEIEWVANKTFKSSGWQMCRWCDWQQMHLYSKWQRHF